VPKSSRAKSDALTYADGLPIEAGDEVAIQRRLGLPELGLVTYIYDPTCPPDREFNDYGFCVRTKDETTRWYGGSPEWRVVLRRRKAPDPSPREGAPPEPRRVHDPDSIPSTWIRDRFPTEPAGPPGCQRLSGRVEIAKPEVFPTGGGGELHFRPGGFDASFWVSLAEPRDETDDLVVETHVADDKGTGWTCRAYMVASLLVETDRAEPFVRWDAAPPQWQDAMMDNCLLSGLYALLDARYGYDLRLHSGDPLTAETYPIKEKHQGATVDLALVQSTGNLLVRVSQLYHEVYPRGTDWRSTPTRATDMGMLPTYAYELPPSVLFPRASLTQYAGRFDWFFEPVENPIKFWQWGARGEAQENVVPTTDS
jgi:hypothetical protein